MYQVLRKFPFQILPFVLLCLDDVFQLSKVCASSPDFSLQRANILVMLIEFQNMLGTGRTSTGRCVFVGYGGQQCHITLPPFIVTGDGRFYNIQQGFLDLANVIWAGELFGGQTSIDDQSISVYSCPGPGNFQIWRPSYELSKRTM
jgi:hypothetical protein